MIQRITQVGLDGMTWGELRHFVAMSPHLPDSPVALIFDEADDSHPPIALAFYEEVKPDGGDQ